MSHRISLRRGWKKCTSELPAPEKLAPEELSPEEFPEEQWERIFHAPTLPTPMVEVRLVISPCIRVSQIQLNGRELTWSQEDSRLDCEVTHCLERVNRISVRGTQTAPCHPTDGDRLSLTSPFDAYLEICEDA